LAGCFSRKEEIDSAIRQFQAALKLKPDFVQAHVNFANALIRKGDLSGALRESQEATRLAPNDSETHRTLGRALDFSGDRDQAIREFRRAIELEPQRPELHDDLGTVLARKKTHKRQQPNSLKLSAYNPLSRKRICTLACCSINNGH